MDMVWSDVTRTSSAQYKSDDGKVSDSTPSYWPLRHSPTRILAEVTHDGHS